MKSASFLKGKILTVLPNPPHPGLDPFFVEKEIHKYGKVYPHEAYESAVFELLTEQLIEEAVQGLFRKKERR